MTPSGSVDARARRRRVARRAAATTGAACVRALRRRRRRHRQRPEDADDVPHRPARCDMARGNLGDFLDWWVVLRSLIDGRAGAHARRGRRSQTATGAPLDLHRVVHARRRRRRHRALPRRGRLPAPARLVRRRRDARDLRRHGPRAPRRTRRDDGRSWWAKTADGDDRCVRMEYFHEHSATTCASCSRASGSCASAGFVDGDYAPRTAGNRIEALVKPIGVVEGISDVPWHKDCSLGMHSYRCCGLTVGISVTGADARSGQLRVVAGSHRALVQPAFVRSSSRPADRRPADRDRRRRPCTAAARSTCRSRRSTASAR